MIWLILAIITVAVLISLVTPLLRNGSYSRAGVSLFFVAFCAFSIGTYALIGRADLLKQNALQPYQAPKGPNAEQVQAAQQMSPQERADMIVAMVEGLAARLEDEPNDPQGWARLLRARKVLGQKEKLQADTIRMKLIFKDSPETIDMILKAAE